MPIPLRPLDIAAAGPRGLSHNGGGKMKVRRCPFPRRSPCQRSEVRVLEAVIDCCSGATLIKSYEFRSITVHVVKWMLVIVHSVWVARLLDRNNWVLFRRGSISSCLSKKKRKKSTGKRSTSHIDGGDVDDASKAKLYGSLPERLWNCWTNYRKRQGNTNTGWFTIKKSCLCAFHLEDGSNPARFQWQKKPVSKTKNNFVTEKSYRTTKTTQEKTITVIHFVLCGK